MEIKDVLNSMDLNLNFDTNDFKKSLLSDPNILKVIEELNLDDDMIDNNLTPLMQYRRYLMKDPTLPVSMLNEDYDLKLVKDDSILRLDYILKEESKNKYLKQQTHNNFWINHLSEKLLEVDKDSLSFDHYHHLSGVQKILKLKVNDSRGVYVYGTVGIGKTYLLAYKANQFVHEGYKVCFVNFSRLLNELKMTFVSQNDEFASTMNKLMNCHFLVIDDLGSEALTPWSRDDILFQILDYRMQHEYLTCFTSNLSLEQLQHHFSNTKGALDEVKIVRLMERIEVLSDAVLLTSNKKSLRRL